jgi:ribonuclease HI
LKAVNGALQRDRLLTDRLNPVPLAIKKQLALNTWSGLLKDEDSLPDNWTHEGVIVGMQPINDRHGIG